MLGHVAVGTWSGGRFMRFGEPISDERMEALLRPGNGIDTLITADAYGAGEADTLLGRALRGVPRGDYCLVGAVGHDFYEGEREGAKGFPRFTDPRLRAPDGYAAYLRLAAQRPLPRARRLRCRPADGGGALAAAPRSRPLRSAAAAQPRPRRLHQPGGVGGH